MQNKKVLLIFSIIIILVGIIGFLLLNLNNTTTTSRDDVNSIPQKIVNDEIEPEKENLENKVIDTSISRLSECANYPDKYVVPEIQPVEGFGTFTGQRRPVNDRNQCISKIAVKEKDTSLCNSISDEEGMLRCQGNVIREIAEEKDISLCSSISDEEVRAGCLSVTYHEIAVDKDNPNPSLCDRVIGSKKRCIYASYYYVAQNSENPDICDNIDDLTDRQNCYSGVVSVTGDASICTRMEQWRQGYCRINAANAWLRLEAVEKGDYSLCETMAGDSRSNSRDFCYTEVAIEIKDLEVCENYFEVEEDYYAPYSNIDNCYYRLAEGLKDESVCEGIYHESFVERCIENVRD